MNGPNQPRDDLIPCAQIPVTAGAKANRPAGNGATSMTILQIQIWTRKKSFTGSDTHVWLQSLGGIGACLVRRRSGGEAARYTNGMPMTAEACHDGLCRHTGKENLRR